MECYSEQICALAVDGELPSDEAQRLRDHLTKCRRCRDLVDALRAESRVLSESLHSSEYSRDPGMAESLEPKRSHGPDVRSFLLLCTRRECHVH